MDDRSECRTSLQGGGGGPNPFSLVALLQTLACNVGGQTHTPTRITCLAENSTTCTLFYKPGKVLSLCQNKKTRQNRFELTGPLSQNSN